MNLQEAYILVFLCVYKSRIENDFYEDSTKLFQDQNS